MWCVDCSLVATLFYADSRFASPLIRLSALWLPAPGTFYRTYYYSRHRARASRQRARCESARRGLCCYIQWQQLQFLPGWSRPLMATVARSWRLLAAIIDSGSHFATADGQILQLGGNIPPTFGKWRCCIPAAASRTTPPLATSPSWWSPPWLHSFNLASLSSCWQPGPCKYDGSKQH